MASTGGGSDGAGWRPPAWRPARRWWAPGSAPLAPPPTAPDLIRFANALRDGTVLLFHATATVTGRRAARPAGFATGLHLR
ncbi:hypothetical protein ACWEV3_20155 [Saccharopolyspora sp. NPDC003752]